MIVAIHKPPGWTPLEAMEELRARTPALAGEPMVYAGRLDPMAEGVLLVLAGADRHALAAHLGHDKTYVATLLFGARSDTHDALGRIAVGARGGAARGGAARGGAARGGVARGGDGGEAAAADGAFGTGARTLDRCAEAVAALIGTHRLPLPAWSAYRVRGRPLHAWAREGRLDEVDVPARDMTVTAVEHVVARPVRAAGLLDDVGARIRRVRGDFRQAEALADWARLTTLDPPLVTVTATLTVTSGTYVRALAHALGERLGRGGLLLALLRTRVGPFRLADVRPIHDAAS